MSFSSSERSQLVALLRELGPDAPTLCAGWTTHDLVAHLWLRENQPHRAIGLLVPAFAGSLARAMEQVKAREFAVLVDAWASGPQPANPFRFLDARLNMVEHFIHHEDVRRCNGDAQPREFSAAVTKQLHQVAAWMAPLLLRHSAAPVVLVPAGLPRIVAADRRGVSQCGDDVVTVTGTVPELLLWVMGRDVAQVNVLGDATKVRKSSF